MRIVDCCASVACMREKEDAGKYFPRLPQAWPTFCFAQVFEVPVHTFCFARAWSVTQGLESGWSPVTKNGFMYPTFSWQTKSDITCTAVSREWECAHIALPAQ